MKLPFRLGGFGTIIADPPWHFDDQAGRMKLPYKSMSADELLAMPVATLGAEAAHLYCWTTDAHLELALACIPRWGFEFKMTLVWAKTTHNGAKLRFGGGHWIRHAHELVLFAVRPGTPAADVHDVPSVFYAPRREHSAKPPNLHEIAERISPAPRLELFARTVRAGWLCWGDECPVTDSTEPG